MNSDQKTEKWNHQHHQPFRAQFGPKQCGREDGSEMTQPTEAGQFQRFSVGYATHLGLLQPLFLPSCMCIVHPVHAGYTSDTQL